MREGHLLLEIKHQLVGVVDVVLPSILLLLKYHMGFWLGSVPRLYSTLELIFLRHILLWWKYISYTVHSDLSLHLRGAHYISCLFYFPPFMVRLS